MEKIIIEKAFINAAEVNKDCSGYHKFTIEFITSDKKIIKNLWEKIDLSFKERIPAKLIIEEI